MAPGFDYHAVAHPLCGKPTRQSEPPRRLRQPQVRSALASFVLTTVLAGMPCSAQNPSANATLAGEIAHAREMRRLFPDAIRGAQATPL